MLLWALECCWRRGGARAIFLLLFDPSQGRAVDEVPLQEGLYCHDGFSHNDGLVGPDGPGRDSVCGARSGSGQRLEQRSGQGVNDLHDYHKLVLKGAKQSVDGIEEEKPSGLRNGKLLKKQTTRSVAPMAYHQHTVTLEKKLGNSGLL